jgi:ADP-heptose:LPS heptosyltransferase
MLEPTGLIEGATTYDPISRSTLVPSFLSIRRTVKDGRFDAVATLHDMTRGRKQVDRDRLVFRLAGARRTLGFRHFDQSPIDLTTKTCTHEALLRLRRLEMDGVETREDEDLRGPLLVPPPHDASEVDQWLSVHRKHPSRTLFGMCLGTVMPSKEWPLDRFLEVGRRVLTEGTHELVVVGSGAERETADQAIAAWGGGLNACGEFTVLQSGALLQRCSLFLGLDTGTTHLAAAVGTPFVALYADMTYRGQWNPIGAEGTIFREQVACGACHLKSCPVEGHPCMTGIGVEPVWQAIRGRLGAA